MLAIIAALVTLAEFNIGLQRVPSCDPIITSRVIIALLVATTVQPARLQSLSPDICSPVDPAPIGDMQADNGIGMKANWLLVSIHAPARTPNSRAIGGVKQYHLDFLEEEKDERASVSLHDRRSVLSVALVTERGPIRTRGR